MRTLSVFNSVTVDGYFTGPDDDMSWAYDGGDDPEWQAFVSGNASDGGTLLFGRVTYDQMAGFWPTPAAMQTMPDVAKGMNRMEKLVVSRTMTSADWANTSVLKGEMVKAVQALKAGTGPDMVILGSGSVVAQLAAAGLIDAYQLVVCPVALGAGRTLFDGLDAPVRLRLTQSRAFQNGKVVNSYVPV